jgi:hypothetical protein
MKKTLAAIAFSSLALVSIVLAQTGPGGGPGGPDPAMRAKFEKYRPWFDLGSTIRIMVDVDKEPKLAFTKAQAKVALPILKDLGSRAALKPEDATKINTMLEDKVVSAAQLKWMDEKRLAQEEERRKRMAQQQSTQSGGIGLPPTGGQGQGGGGQGGPGGPGGGNSAMFDAIQNNKPFNPFKEGRNADTLKQLIDTLSKK